MVDVYRRTKTITPAKSQEHIKFGYAIVYVPSVTDAPAFYQEAFGFETRFLHDSGQCGSALLTFPFKIKQDEARCLELGIDKLTKKTKKAEPLLTLPGICVADG
jgi:hypothetical protein